MPYVHLANGEVVDMTDDELVKSQEESGTPSAFHRDGMQYQVIGVYPKEVEHALSPEAQKEKDAKDAEDRAAFDAWQAHKAAGANAEAARTQVKGTERPTTDPNETVPEVTE